MIPRPTRRSPRERRTSRPPRRPRASSKVYWFNPNLTGGARSARPPCPNLDIRNSASITSLTAASRDKYNDAWLNLVAQSLGNGVTATQHQRPARRARRSRPRPGTDRRQTSTATPLYDYSSGWPAPANVAGQLLPRLQQGQHGRRGSGQDRLLGQPDRRRRPRRRRSQRRSTARPFARVRAVRVVEGGGQRAGAARRPPNAAQRPGRPGPHRRRQRAADGGWRVNQITLPRAGRPARERDGRRRGDPLRRHLVPEHPRGAPVRQQGRAEERTSRSTTSTPCSTAAWSAATRRAAQPAADAQRRTTQRRPTFPSFLYGELVQPVPRATSRPSTRSPATNAHHLLPGRRHHQDRGHGRAPPGAVPVRLQGQGGHAAQGGVTRQWIIKSAQRRANTEYMSSWWLHQPAAEPARPHDAPAGRSVLADDQRRAGGLHLEDRPRHGPPEPAVDTDDAQYLVDADTATVTTNRHGRRDRHLRRRQPDPISPAALAAALAALGASAPTNFAAARTALTRAEPAATPNQTLIANLTTVAGAWGIADTRKSNVATAPGASPPARAASPAVPPPSARWTSSSAACRVASSPRAHRHRHDGDRTAPRRRSASRSPTTHGRKPAGNVALIVKQGGATVAHGVDRGRQRRGVLHAPGPGRGHVRLHALLRG